MYINRIQNNNPKSEIIVVSRKPAFAAKKPVQRLITPGVIERFGLNMKTRVGYRGKGEYIPAPDTLPEVLKRYMDKLEINWGAHIDKNAKTPSF